jgi:hypothetical protein
MLTKEIYPVIENLREGREGILQGTLTVIPANIKKVVVEYRFLGVRVYKKTYHTLSSYGFKYSNDYPTRF